MEHTHRMHSTHARSGRRRERFTLLGLVALMTLSGIGLAASGGPPRLPAGVPRVQDLSSALLGSTLPAEPLALALVDLTWLLWLWIVASLGLELLVEAAEAVAHGAAWVRSLRRLTDRLTFPLARRAVAAAFALQLLGRGVPLASAQTLSPVDTAPVVVNADRQPDWLTAVGASSPQAAPARDGVHYTVRAGDTLWSIADQAYGSGMAYRRLVEANTGRQMPDGQTFTARGVIQPGWELVIPDANLGIEQVDGQRWYTVRDGDTLLRVAAVVLGDASQWRDLFEQNRGSVSPDGTHVLSNPDLIWPGLRLQLPPAPMPMSPDSEPAAPDLDSVPAAPDPNPDPVAAGPDLIAASALVFAAPPAVFEPSLPPTDAPAPPASERDDAPTPLMRTAHPPTVIALEPVDAPVVTEPAPSTDSDGDLQTDVSPDAGGSLPRSRTPVDLPLMPLALGGVGVAALAGVGWRTRRARRLRALPAEPETAVVVAGGFAEAELTHDFTRGLQGMGFDPLTAIAGHVQQCLQEYHLDDVGILALRHGRSSTTLTLTAGLASQPILIDLASEFGARLEADADAWLTADQDIALRLVRLRKTRLLPATGAQPQSVCLVPLGVLFDRQIFVATSTSLGHVLVVSQAGHGADRIVTSLLATLTARRSPERLNVWLIAQPRSLPAPLFDLPHVVRSVDPTDEVALAHAARDLQAELDARSAGTPQTDLIVVVPELTSLGEAASAFEMLAQRAARLGVHFIAASGCPEEALLNPLVGHFGTRLVLRMQDEETSVALLGVADAAFLGGGGRLLLRLDGREPVELYGYQVAGEHLERLVRVMRSAYLPATSPPADPPVRDEPPPSRGPSDDGDTPPAFGDSRPDAPALDTVYPTVPPDPSVSAPGPAEPIPEPVDKTTIAETAPLEVICLGGPRVQCAGQQIWPRPPGGEAKPWELLLYLASQPAEGISIDEAVEALWPGLDEAADAPHRFRQLRYRLRHLLAKVDGAPATDGICLERGVLRLDPRVVHSDAQEFLALVRGARLSPGPGTIEQLERARELYAGDLLEGPDARRYAWVDERDGGGVTLREHFRRLFQHASTRLAELYAATGQPAAAIDIYRELTEIDAGDERLWRALFRLHAERGDRPALVRENHRMREALRRLSDEVDDGVDSHMDDPDRETVLEYQRLLASLRGPDREAAAG